MIAVDTHPSKTMFFRDDAVLSLNFNFNKKKRNTLHNKWVFIFPLLPKNPAPLRSVSGMSSMLVTSRGQVASPQTPIIQTLSSFDAAA